MAKVTATGELLINAAAIAGAQLHAGDEVSVVVDGDGRLIVERRSGRDRRAKIRDTPDRRSLVELHDGVYPRDYLLVARTDERLHGRVAAFA
jgi:antitoxin component of MazEF toxin-antitoxin module